MSKRRQQSQNELTTAVKLKKTRRTFNNNEHEDSEVSSKREKIMFAFIFSVYRNAF